VSLDLYPAIDLRGGKCVRLMQGDYDRETVYGDDPVAQARLFADAGAPWIHVVDLDAARSGEPVNRPVVAAIAAAVAVPVQTGGGVRSVAAAEALFEAGVSRVVIGTAAVENPELAEALASRGMRVAIGLDGRNGKIATHGWETETDMEVVEMARRFESIGVDAVVVTEIARDGTLEGPDLEGLAAVLGGTHLDVIASGGVGTADHLRRLAELESEGRTLSGVIVGRALYEGTVDLGEGLAACTGEPR
jgi:phosphoribosylformimino-5-aminoimidazole carboxamide ribotide isomerase